MTNPVEKAAFEPLEDRTGTENTKELTFPDTRERPCYRVYSDRCGPDNKRPPGVYRHTVKKAGDDVPPVLVDTWICAPLLVEALTRDETDHNYGHLLRFINRDGNWKTWNMPARMLRGSGEDLRGELLDMGLKMDIDHKKAVPAYINAQEPKQRLRAALSTGWFGDVFVLPDRTVGDGNPPTVFYQSEYAGQREYTQRGTLDEWRQNVAKYCAGNPLLVFAVSVAFVGPLLKMHNLSGAGFHVFGSSRTGKTTGNKVACSIWGNWESYTRSWKATANGLEAVASLFNDGLLVLDEMSDGDADEIRKTIYALHDGRGKQRSNVNGGAKALRRWRVAVLSNGEKTIEAQLSEKGFSAKAGQLNRLLQFEVFGKYGAFDELHGSKDGGAFSDLMTSNAQQHYGTAGIEFLERLTVDLVVKRSFSGYLTKMIDRICPDKLTGQEQCAAKSFAVIAIAGELATEYDITGWDEGAALDAAKQCFNAWRQQRGAGNVETAQVTNAIAEFVSLHGESRFTDYLDTSARITAPAGRAGYWRQRDGDEREWLFTVAGLKQAVPGFDNKQTAKILDEAGWLKKSGSGKRSETIRISGKSERLYVVKVQGKDDGP